MNKTLPILVGVVILLVVTGGIVFAFSKRTNPNDQKMALVETPPSVNKVNTLPLAQRPYVALIPHTQTDTSIGCNGLDLVIDNLKNQEQTAEYEVEYHTAKLIQGMEGTRDFTKPQKSYDPLIFGTCSSGRCRCDTGITGGYLKLDFSGKQEYTLKYDYNIQNVGDKQGQLNSEDSRLTIAVNNALPKSTNLVIMDTFGLPKELSDKVVLGPYGIFAEGNTTLKKPMTVTLQSQDVSKGKVQFYDGDNWQVLQTKVDGDKATFEISKLGVIVLTE